MVQIILSYKNLRLFIDYNSLRAAGYASASVRGTVVAMQLLELVADPRVLSSESRCLLFVAV